MNEWVNGFTENDRGDFLVSLPVTAQTFGEITGPVADGTGAVIPGATIRSPTKLPTFPARRRVMSRATIRFHFSTPVSTTRGLRLRASALEDGRKQLLAVHDGFRESELSWQELLEDLKRQGLDLPPKLAVGDGALGFWAALRKVFPATREQRCWLHKTVNVLDKLPKSMQGKAKQALHDVYLAESRETAENELDRFKNLYKKKYPKAVECLEKDRKVLLSFYDFPAEHWVHLRTTNPIESTFATVRLRQRRTKGCGSREASLTMVFMLVRQAERHWRRLNGAEVIVHVLEGKEFKDGLMVQHNAA